MVLDQKVSLVVMVNEELGMNPVSTVHFESDRKLNENGRLLTLSLLSSKCTFSQPFKEKFIGEVMRIGSIILFSLSEAMKSKFLHTV